MRKGDFDKNTFDAFDNKPQSAAKYCETKNDSPLPM